MEYICIIFQSQIYTKYNNCQSHNKVMTELRRLRKGLKHGDIKLIAKDTGHSPAYISRVLRGEEIRGKVLTNDHVLNVAIEYFQANERSKNDLDKKIKKVLAKSNQ